LAATRDREAATATVLRAVGESGDIGSVLDAIATTAARLVDVDFLVLMEVVGEEVVAVAAAEEPSRTRVAEARARGQPRVAVPLTDHTVSGRALLERRTIVVEDLRAARLSEFTDVTPEAAGPARSLVSMPMI